MRDKCFVPVWRGALEHPVPYPHDHHDRIEAERQMIEACFHCKDKCEKREI